MKNTVSFNVTYDRGSDVLYLSSHRAPATKGRTDDYGILWRYDSNGNLIGATITDYADYWLSHIAKLERELSEKFAVPVHQMQVVLQKVLQK